MLRETATGVARAAVPDAAVLGHAEHQHQRPRDGQVGGHLHDCRHTHAGTQLRARDVELLLA